MARIAKSLDVLRAQVNAKWPNRSKVSDGWIGDPAHATRESDHNPNSAGVVTALDITHDPAKGPDTWKLAEILRQRKDPRIKYVISNGRIFSSAVEPWKWRTYTGTNKHAHHVHISVNGDQRQFDNEAPWSIDDSGVIAPIPPVIKPPAGITASMRRRMMEIMLGYEGRFVGGKLEVHIATDGLPEIGGITQKDHPTDYARLKKLLDAGQQGILLQNVLNYYQQYTQPAQGWTDQAGLEFFLRDCILNRGPTGAAIILQKAVGVEEDGQVGPTTRGALADLNPDDAIDKLRAARERYELEKYGRRTALWNGLVNRWNKAQAQAKAFQKEQGKPDLSGVGGAGTVIVVGTGTVAAAKKDPWTPAEIAMAGFSIAVAAVLAFIIIRKIRRKP